MSGDSVDVRAVRSLFAALRTPFYGDADHQPRLIFRTASTSRVVCTCGVELGIVSTVEGMDRVKSLHAEHVGKVAS